MQTLEVLTTRLFPKNRGADSYVISGVAGRCDWVVLSDRKPPKCMLVRRVLTDRPRHVFLSMRAPYDALAFFSKEVVPLLVSPFVLVSGSEDVTVPNQTDLRQRPFDQREREWIGGILGNPLLCHWFAENLDDAGDARMSPLPVGMVFAQQMPFGGIEIPDVPPLARRPLRILCAHRTREGPQWDLRRRVSQLAGTAWRDWTTILSEEVPEQDFLEMIARHAFVLCVSGGGLDPSPKAWVSLLHGAIPIVRSGSLDAAYRELPVAFVPDWLPESITAEKLRLWQEQLAPAQDVAPKRQATLAKLGLDYWWHKIVDAWRPTN